MMMAENISYSAGGKKILDAVSLTMRPGAITAILGPNGAGKSTLLKCLTGALTPESGRILLEGTPLGEYPLHALAKKRAVLSQLGVINFPFTVQEIVLMGRHPHLMEREGEHDLNIARETLEALDVWPLKDRIYQTLSGGEQQRVQLARALAQIWEQENIYLFLDEPTSAQDIKYRMLILRLLGELKEKNIGIACVLHDLNEASMFADRIALLKDGQLIAEENTEDCLTEARIEAVYGVSAEILRSEQARPVFTFRK